MLIFDHDTFCEKDKHCTDCGSSRCFCVTRFFFRHSEEAHEFANADLALFLFALYGIGNFDELLARHNEVLKLEQGIRVQN